MYDTRTRAHTHTHTSSIYRGGINFKQDNDPTHTSDAVKQYLANKVTAGVIQVLEGPPHNPDMSHIEAIWDYLEKEKKKRSSTHLTKL